MQIEPTEWHIDKRVSVTHLIATLVMAGAIFTWAIKQDQRLTRMEERSALVEQRLDREISRTAHDLSVIRQSILRMEDRLERSMRRSED